MKIASIVGALLVTASVAAAADVSSEDLLKAVDQMSPEQAHAFSQKLEAKLWKPVPEGFFGRMAVDLGVTGSQLDKVNLNGVSQSGGERDVESASGMDIGLLWRAYSPRLRLGVRLESWAATDDNLGAGGYTRVDLQGGGLLAVINYQWVRSDHWLVWTEVGGGGGGVALDTVDTPVGQATTLRSFDGTYGMGSAQAGAAWRLNRAIALFASGGYRLAESVELDEGGQDTAVEVDASGPSGRVGLGVNF
ncbi:MAG: hypothetical protein K8T26_18405 [Lentisphaerae bacterium]|nr:hypothetical protein [Lentisphaerota bacterium]